MSRWVYKWLIYRPSAWVCFVMLRIIYRAFRRHGDRIPRNGPLLFVANHQSHFDPLLVGGLVTGHSFVSLARDTLFSFKPFGLLLRFYSTVPLDQKKGDLAAFRIALDALKRGENVLVFPEGSRTIDGTLQEFKAGILILIRRSGVPVVPIAIDGAYDVWRRGTSGPSLSGRLGVMAGHPIEPEAWKGMTPDGMLKKLHDEIEGMRLELRAEIRRKSDGRWPSPGPADNDASVPAMQAER